MCDTSVSMCCENVCTCIVQVFLHVLCKCDIAQCAGSPPASVQSLWGPLRSHKSPPSSKPCTLKPRQFGGDLGEQGPVARPEVQAL